MSIQTTPAEQSRHQRLFDATLQHIRTQRKPSINIKPSGDVSCLYRTPDGLQCAAGIFITNYDGCMENQKWSTLLIRHQRAVAVDAVIAANFVNELQLCHDNAARAATKLNVRFLEAFEQNMELLAEMYGLTYTPPSEALVVRAPVVAETKAATERAQELVYT